MTKVIIGVDPHKLSATIEGSARSFGPVRMPPAIDSASHKCSSTFRGGLGLNPATIIPAGPSCRCLQPIPRVACSSPRM